MGKDLCPAHRRWVRFQDTYRPCPECGRVHPDVWRSGFIGRSTNRFDWPAVVLAEVSR
jgi:hypothetical protein